MPGRTPPRSRPRLDEPDYDFGAGVALSSEFLLAGTSRDDEARGAGWLYERTDHGWEVAQKLVAPDAEPSVWAAEQVAFDGESAVISARFADTWNGAADTFTSGACELDVRLERPRVELDGTLEPHVRLAHHRLREVTVPLELRVEDADGRTVSRRRTDRARSATEITCWRTRRSTCPDCRPVATG